MDPLSSVLSLINTRDVNVGRLFAEQGWCIQSPAYTGLRFGVVLEGICWLQVADVELPSQLCAGDCYLLTDGRAYRIGSDLTLPAMAMDEVFELAVESDVRLGTGSDFHLVGGRFSLEGAQAAFLLDSLAPMIHVPAATQAAGGLRAALESMADEQKESQAGAVPMMEHLAHVMLIHIMRSYLRAAHGQGLSGWLAALADPRIGAALALLHGEPARRWSLGELANAVGMSRSAFAARFRTQVGDTPLNYLVAWRMRLAGQALRSKEAPVSSIGLSFGYDSESAFSSVFKRVMGCSPRAYRQLSNKSG